MRGMIIYGVIVDLLRFSLCFFAELFTIGKKTSVFPAAGDNPAKFEEKIKLGKTRPDTCLNLSSEP